MGVILLVFGLMSFIRWGSGVNRFSEDNMCGVWDLNFDTPPPVPKFSCPAEKPSEATYDDGLFEKWPWIGTVEDKKKGLTNIGVVISEDTIVTDLQFAEDSPVGVWTSTEPPSPSMEDSFTFTLEFDGNFFRSSVQSTRLEDGKVMFLRLRDTIPPNMFRPACLPPKNYVTKMVKSQSCKGRPEQKITKVNFRAGNVEKTQELIVDENMCSLSLLESRICTDSFPAIFSSADEVMKKDTKYINGSDNKHRTCRPGTKCAKRDIEQESENYYKCHVGAVTASAKCSLPEIRSETKCVYVEEDSCLGFVGKQYRKKKGTRNTKEQTLLDCATEVTDDYSKCIVESYEETSVSGAPRKDDKHFKGVNCLHEFIKMPECAAAPLGKTWIFNPCYFPNKPFNRRAYDICIKRPENQWFKTEKPFEMYWSKSMIEGVQEFSDNISEKLQCGKCSAGPSKCTKPLERVTIGETSFRLIEAAGTQDFLFWFDSCRDKWFFLGPSSSVILRTDFPSSCEIPQVYPDLESIAATMRDEVAGKVEDIHLYPKPVIVVLGPTGVGKSTTGNALLSGNKAFSSCFSMGSGINSKTKVTEWKVGKWLGVGQCVTVVDTPGTDDTSGSEQDYENIKELTRFLKQDLKEIDIFLVMFKEQDKRFVPSMEKAIAMFESIFGKESFWSNVATEFTFWDFGEGPMEKRYQEYCTEKDLNCPDIFEPPGTCDYPPYCYSRRKREIVGVDDVKCKMMTADAELSSNQDIFIGQDLRNPSWNDLIPYNNLDKDSFVSYKCRSDQEYIKFNRDLYEKADFVSRMIKKSLWNKEYNNEFDMPYLFIHPVWDTTNNHECEIFKRETTKLWNAAAEMKPFVCTSICQAPDDIFLGTPQIIEFLDQPEARITYKKEGIFSLICTLWNGVGLSGVRGDDIKWYQGWETVDLSDKSKWHQEYVQDERDAFKSIAKLRFTPRMTDIGLYNCALDGIKETSTLSFESSGLLSLKSYEEHKNGQFETSCVLDVSEKDFFENGYQNQIMWFFSKEIDPKNIPNQNQFTKTTTKKSAQYSVSSLNFDFSKKGPKEFEGTFACKRQGKSGFSNKVNLTLDADASWKEWSEWTVCDKPCLATGDTPGTKTRTRDCKLPRNNGLPCKDISGMATETEPCNLVCCPKDGKWSPYSLWSSCTKTCSNEGESPGSYERSRNCIEPQCAGKPCEGTKIQKGDCNTFEQSPCPIDGNWGEWGSWSDCIEDSDDPCRGQNKRERVCNAPAQDFGGTPCGGAKEEFKFCEVLDCPVDCECNDFSDDLWGPCSQSCTPTGGISGTQTSHRVCTEGANKGKTCRKKYVEEMGEELIQTRTCNPQCCPVHGFMTEWSKWDKCNVLTGTHKRGRTCEKPECGGRRCSGHNEEEENCDVDCRCDDIDWSAWSTCSSECPTCSKACGVGKRKQTRVCHIHINGGRPCGLIDQLKEEECEHLKRCPMKIEGVWGPWGDYSECSVKCGGGFREKTRSCLYPEIEALKSTTEPYDNDFDSKMPCAGEGIETEGKDGTDKCNADSCELSTLVFLMDTTGSFSGVDQNSALDLANGIIDGLHAEKVNVPNYRLITVNDPDTEVMARVASRKDFKATLMSLYKKSHYHGGDWPEQSMEGILNGLKQASHGEVFCLFTDAPSKQLTLQKEIVRRAKKELDIPIFMFLTPDYSIYHASNLPSYRVYQNISRRHTYVMKQTDPSSLVYLIQKYLRSSKIGCMTYAGGTEKAVFKGTVVNRKWEDGPNECQFPFWYGNKEYTQCTTDGGYKQPWCATVVQKSDKNKPEMMKGMWGFCGDCSGEVHPKCLPGGHKVLTDTWRTVDGSKIAGASDDHDLVHDWYRFLVPGTSNTLPTFVYGHDPQERCASESRYGRVELESAANLTVAVPHDKGILEKRICFDATCTDFRRVDVLWCPPEPVGGAQVKTGQPFHIFKLKPVTMLGKGYAYCVL